MAQMTPLRRRMIDNMTGRNLSPATQQSYVYGEPSSAVSSAFRWIPYITLAEGQEPVRSRRRPGGTESSNPLPSSGESRANLRRVSSSLGIFAFGPSRGFPCRDYVTRADAARRY
jgi:hypothetical protein